MSLDRWERNDGGWHLWEGNGIYGSPREWWYLLPACSPEVQLGPFRTLKHAKAVAVGLACAPAMQEVLRGQPEGKEAA